MINHEELLARQAAWQKTRREMSWPEKIRQAEKARTATEALRPKRVRRPPLLPRDQKRSQAG